MLTTYFRSSSVGSYKLCRAKYFFEYVLGLKSPANKAASKGSCFHKVMECLALSKKCQQDGTTSFIDDVAGEIHINECEPELLFERFKNHFAEESRKDWEGTAYEAKETWKNSDFKDIETWLSFSLCLDGGRYDPRLSEIVCVERFFDIELPYEWARYDFTAKGQHLTGQLRIRGSIDLGVRAPDGTLVLRDYKTGKMTDYSKPGFKDKSYAQLCEEFQFRLYYWLSRQMYPKDEIRFEAFYPQYGGPFDLYITDADGEKAITYLKDIFRQIKNSQKPVFLKNTVTNPMKSACCFCSFRKRQHESGVTECDFYESELHKYGGADKMFEAIGNINKMSTYEGGGKTIAEIKSTDGDTKL